MAGSEARHEQQDTDAGSEGVLGGKSPEESWPIRARARGEKDNEKLVVAEEMREKGECEGRFCKLAPSELQHLRLGFVLAEDEHERGARAGARQMNLLQGAVRYIYCALVRDPLCQRSGGPLGCSLQPAEKSLCLGPKLLSTLSWQEDMQASLPAERNAYGAYK